jgi:hypothetical protein
VNEQWSDYAVFLGIVIALASAWWRMDAFRDKLDALRDRTRDERHDHANKVQLMIDKIEEDQKDQGHRLVRLERNGHPK